MSSIQQLESLKRIGLGQAIIELGKEALSLGVIDSSPRQLKMIGGGLVTGSLSYSEAHTEIERTLEHFTHANEIDVKKPGTVWNCKELPLSLKSFGDKFRKMERELSTPRESVSKLYRVGTIGHGVLQAITVRGATYLTGTHMARGGCTSKELKAYFPSLNDASTLTHMRREGVIEKTGNTTSPWTLTVLGEQLLRERGGYTLDMFKLANKDRDIPTKSLPWDLSADEHNKFVEDQTADARKGC